MIHINKKDILKYDDNYEKISLDVYLKKPSTSTNTLIIYYGRTHIISYKHMCNDLYKNKDDIIRINNIIKNYKGIKILLIHDIHNYTFDGGYNAFSKFCVNVGIDYVFGNYCDNKEYNIIKNICIKNKTKLITIPNLIDNNIFYNMNLKKDFDILIYGAMDESAYPFRVRLLNLLKHNKFSWRVRIIKYGELRGVELSKEINKSIMSIATCSKYNYFLKKYMEIAMSNSLVVGNMSTQGKHIFENDYLHIDDNMTNNEIYEEINKMLANKELINHKINIMHKKMIYLDSKYIDIYRNKALNII